MRKGKILRAKSRPPEKPENPAWAMGRGRMVPDLGGDSPKKCLGRARTPRGAKTDNRPTEEAPNRGRRANHHLNLIPKAHREAENGEKPKFQKRPPGPNHFAPRPVLGGDSRKKRREERQEANPKTRKKRPPFLPPKKMAISKFS